jgi:uncharacterized protein (DUF2141 family)
MKLPVLLIFPFFALPWHSDAARLTVVVEGVQSSEGRLIVNLFDKEESWLKTAARSEEQPAVKGPMTVVFEDLPAGDYGLWVHHDKNGDGQLNKGLFGKPEEPYGFSNDSGKLFGPADWEDAKVTLTKDANTSIRVHVK